MGKALSITSLRDYAWFGAVLLVPFLCACGGSGGDTALREDSVVTQYGPVKGQTSGAVQSFKAVPYAAPPVGDLRWRAPQKPAGWTSARASNTLPPPCPQAVTGRRAYEGTGYSEDCLYLNVYRPSAHSGGLLPVHVFIHGAGFTASSSRDYDGSRLAREGSALVVIPNHRRNVFGYLALSSMNAEAGEANGNFGYLDIIAALQWVQDNAARFGGDPGNVTLSGTSGGGVATCLLLVTPRASKLFHKVINMSGPCDGPFIQYSYGTAQADGAAYAARLGCTNALDAAVCLRRKTVEELLSVAAPGVVGPTIGTGLISEAPDAAFASGNFLRVPVMFGALKDERRTLGYNLFGTAGALNGYEAYVRANFGLNADRVLTEYPAGAYTDPAYALGAVASDSGSNLAIGVCRFLRRADLLAAHTAVYFFEVDDPNGPAALAVQVPAGIETGSTHGDNYVWMFGTPPLSLPLDQQSPTYSPNQSRMVADFVQTWASFASDATPSAGTTKFEPYGRTGGWAMLLGPSGNRVLSREALRGAHHCDFWDRLS